MPGNEIIVALCLLQRRNLHLISFSLTVLHFHLPAYGGWEAESCGVPRAAGAGSGTRCRGLTRFCRGREPPRFLQRRGDSIALAGRALRSPCFRFNKTLVRERTRALKWDSPFCCLLTLTFVALRPHLCNGIAMPRGAAVEDAT